MAATKAQGTTFTLFMGGLTAACAGIASFSTGTGKAALGLGIICVAVSFAYFLKLKPLEGGVSLGAQPAVAKIAGVTLALAGWLVVLVGLHLTASVSGRMTTTVLGIAITLVGVLWVLPSASSKHAIWKA
jgi:heme/copper-type cytochrome/quinol oxidase subunit 4